MSKRKSSEEIQEILDIGYQAIMEVSYKVSLRWLFYVLLQKGYFTEKGDYNKLKNYCIKARKEGNWPPDILADESRSAHTPYIGDDIEPEDWVQDVLDNVTNPEIWTCDIDKWKYHNPIEVWFEARAMLEQFKKWVPDFITLVPFGGDPSIPYKYECAMRLSDHPGTTVLYFGDSDHKGRQIADSALWDIERWCYSDFDFIWCGLTKDQAREYKIPENPDRPGQYQWEALKDHQAGEIITASIDMYTDQGLLDKVLDEQREAEKVLKEKFVAIFGDLE